MTVENAVPSEYCDKIIARFNRLEKTHSVGGEKIWNRQEQEGGIDKLKKEDDTYFLGGDAGDAMPPLPGDDQMYNTDTFLLREFTNAVWKSYQVMTQEYSVLNSVANHYICPAVRVQRTKPGQGYHMWHCDAGNVFTSRRIVVISLFLNTVEEGGETEFLYQQRRISPVQGTMLFFPSGWTHVHRGNPPLSGDKYIITTWLEMAYEESIQNA